MHTDTVSAAEITVEDIFTFLASRWRWLLAGLFFGAIVALLYAFLQAPIYRSEILVTPANNDAAQSGLSSLAGQFGGLGQLASIVGVGGGEASELVALLKSRKIAQSFIESEQLLQYLYPNNWDTTTMSMVPAAGRLPPTMSQAVARFNSSIKEISENKLTGLVLVSIEWSDRTLAAKWANDFVAHVNEIARSKAIEESGNTISYLTQQLSTNDILEVKQAIYKVIEASVTRRAMAATRRDFGFRVVDPAVVPDLGTQVRPRTLLLVSIGAAAGVALSLALLSFLLFYQWTRNKR